MCLCIFNVCDHVLCVSPKRMSGLMHKDGRKARLFSLCHFYKEFKSSLVLWVCVCLQDDNHLILESGSILSDSAHDSSTMSTSS